MGKKVWDQQGDYQYTWAQTTARLVSVPPLRGIETFARRATTVHPKQLAISSSEEEPLLSLCHLESL